MPIESLGIQEADLLKVLCLIMEERTLPAGAAAMLDKLIDAGLVNASDDGLTLTAAGVARTQSLQLREESDRDAARIRGERREVAAGHEAYSSEITDIGVQESELLDCLLMLDRAQAIPDDAADLVRRLARAGLVDLTENGPVLTVAGVGRCQSLQQRVLSDEEATSERKRRRDE